MCDPLSVRLGPEIALFQCFQYQWAREFPDYKMCLGNNCSIDLLMSNSHDPSMYTFCTFLYLLLKITLNIIILIFPQNLKFPVPGTVAS